MSHQMQTAHFMYYNFCLPRGNYDPAVSWYTYFVTDIIGFFMTLQRMSLIHLQL